MSQCPGCAGSGITNGSRKAVRALVESHTVQGIMGQDRTGASIRFHSMRSVEVATPIRCQPLQVSGMVLTPV